MTINTQKLREAAVSVRAFLKLEYGREISAAADIIEALEGQVAEYAQMLEKQGAEADARIDAQAAEIARLRDGIEEAIRLLGMDRPINPTTTLARALSGESKC